MMQFEYHNIKIKQIGIFLIIVFTLLSFGNRIEAGNNMSSPLVVYGGEPEGIMAAVAAAREGTKTILILERDNPGGLVTYGYLNYLDLNYGPKGKIINKGLFEEWHKMIGEDITFTIDKAKSSFLKLLNNEKNIKLLKNCSLKEIKQKNNYIDSITVENTKNVITINGERFINASQDAIFAKKTGVKFFQGGADIGLANRNMAVTLILKIGNINWNKLKNKIKKGKFKNTYIEENHAWGFSEIGKIYTAHDNNIDLRGFNLVHFDDYVYLNGMLIFDVNPLNKSSLKSAYKRGKQEAKYVLNFLNRKLPGFEKAKLLDFPEELYIRESRHMLALKQLNIKDQFNNKIFSDTIAFASYPLDYQASSPDYEGFVLFNPTIYSIPLRSIIPYNSIRNLLVVGRSSGYSSLAAASARVIPTGMAVGEAAGKAVSLSLKKNIDFVKLSKNNKLINNLQVQLFNKVIDSKKDPIVQDDIIKPHLEFMLSWGLAIGGYNNNFNLDQIISEKEFAHLLVKGLKRRKSPILYKWVPGSLETLSDNSELTRNKAYELLLAATSHRVNKINNDSYNKIVKDEELVNNYILNLIERNKLINRREAYIMISYFLSKYPLPIELKKIRGEYGV